MRLRCRITGIKKEKKNNYKKYILIYNNIIKLFVLMIFLMDNLS